MKTALRRIFEAEFPSLFREEESESCIYSVIVSESNAPSMAYSVIWAHFLTGKVP